MAYKSMPWELEQPFLLPPDLREWLPADHLARAVLDAVACFDLTPFTTRGSEPRGRASYHPGMLLALLLYAYCLGVFSSREIERRCHTDIAFRLISGNRQPDHTTIARFRARYEHAMTRLFTDVLKLCAEAGMVNVGVVAVDSTKMAADASKKANRSYAHIAAQVDEMMTKAKQTDAAEDRLFGDTRGDELPTQLRDRSHRLERFQQAKQRLEDETAAEHEQWERREANRQQAAEAGKNPVGRPRKHPDPEPVLRGGGLIPPILTRGYSNARAGMCRAIRRRPWLPRTGSSSPVR